MKRKQTKTLCFLNLSDSEPVIEPAKRKKKKGKLFNATDVPDMNQIDVTIGQLNTGRYELTIPDDIYGSGFPLHNKLADGSDGMDGKLETVQFKGSRKKVSVLKGSGTEPDGSLPSGTYIDATNYFNVRLKPVPKRKPRRSKYRTIVRRTSDGKIAPQRHRVSDSDYTLLTGGVVKHIKTTAICRRSGVKYLAISRFQSIIAYLASVSLEQLYSENIRTRVNCVTCGTVATLKAYENGLSCGKCWFSVYNVVQYRIRYFYIDSFNRYELNELTGIVRKQTETSRGFRTIYQGSLNL